MQVLLGRLSHTTADVWLTPSGRSYATTPIVYPLIASENGRREIIEILWYASRRRRCW